jgi:hypothetical protein
MVAPHYKAIVARWLQGSGVAVSTSE